MKRKVQAKQFYTPQEAAAVLDVSPMTIYRLINSGKLDGRKIGNSRNSHLRINKDSLETYLGCPIAAPIEVEIEKKSPPAAAAPEEPRSYGTIAEVLAAIDALTAAVSAAADNPRYTLLGERITSLLDGIAAQAQELRALYEGDAPEAPEGESFYERFPERLDKWQK